MQAIYKLGTDYFKPLKEWINGYWFKTSSTPSPGKTVNDVLVPVSVEVASNSASRRASDAQRFSDAGSSPLDSLCITSLGSRSVTEYKEEAANIDSSSVAPTIKGSSSKDEKEAEYSDWRDEEQLVKGTRLCKEILRPDFVAMNFLAEQGICGSLAKMRIQMELLLMNTGIESQSTLTEFCSVFAYEILKVSNKDLAEIEDMKLFFDSTESFVHAINETDYQDLCKAGDNPKLGFTFKEVFTTLTFALLRFLEPKLAASTSVDEILKTIKPVHFPYVLLLHNLLKINDVALLYEPGGIISAFDEIPTKVEGFEDEGRLENLLLFVVSLIGKKDPEKLMKITVRLKESWHVDVDIEASKTIEAPETPEHEWILIARAD